MSLPTFGANHDLVAALAKYGARFMVVGGVATTFHVPERQTHDPGELDLLIDPSPENAKKVVAALETLGVRDLTVERLTKPYVQMPLKKRFQGGDFYADMLTPYSDEDFTACWERAAEDSISWVTVKVISKADQIARLRRSGQEKHARDVELLERALREKD
ncbi:MAG: hypothetical protein E6J67_20110 [Deltaproteobacteria bacterium]|nr:MAG: hypothetical protein E6J67_20110 [Deltaproteobacteria bacterium]